MGAFLSSIINLFFSKKIECVLVGLENSGKSTFCTYLELGNNNITQIPTIGLNVKTLSKDGVSFKVWDLGGQRDEWVRYCKGCNVIIFVVDTNDIDKLPEAKMELHRLLEDTELNKIPLLILANKTDIAKINRDDLIRSLNLDYIVENPWVLTSISAKNGDNVDKALEFLLLHAQSS